MNKQVSATKIYITYTNTTIYHLFYDFFQKPLCISFNYFNHHRRFKTNANVKLTKSSQALRYGIYYIARRALKLITEKLQYGIYYIAIVVLKLLATTSRIYCIATYCQTIQIANYVRNCLYRNIALILSMKLSNYRRNILHRRIVLLFLYCERLWTEFVASSHTAKSHYILRIIHGF